MLTAVTGINWGDEGKGRVIDLLAEQADIVVRYQGGNNAGHTVVTDQGNTLTAFDLEGNIVEGTNHPTSEKEVHRQIYLRREDAGMIIHAHTKKAMAVSVRKIREVPCLVEEMSQLIGGGIPITPQYVPAEQHFQLGTAAAENIGNRNGVILRNHGPVAVGRNPEEAVLMVEVIEKACEIFLDQGQMFYAPIPQCYIDSERYRYLYKYGNEKT